MKRMQKAIEKAHEWQQNLQSPEYKAFLDELSAHGYPATMSTTTRTIRTKQYNMVMPTFLDVNEKIKALKLERNELILDYTFVTKQLVFGDRDDVETNEKYGMLAKRLTDIQIDILTLEKYSSLVSEVSAVQLAMIHPPQMIPINNKKNKTTGPLKGGADSTIILSPSQREVAKVKQLLKSNFGKKIEVAPAI
jgi:hypothetical protein